MIYSNNHKTIETHDEDVNHYNLETQVEDVNHKHIETHR